MGSGYSNPMNLFIYHPPVTNPTKNYKKIYCKLKQNKNRLIELVKVKNAGHNYFVDTIGFGNYCRKLFCFIYF